MLKKHRCSHFGLRSETHVNGSRRCWRARRARRFGDTPTCGIGNVMYGGREPKENYFVTVSNNTVYESLIFAYVKLVRGGTAAR
jgi:hypothetical protein